jgi:hypothetical protein
VLGWPTGASCQDEARTIIERAIRAQWGTIPLAQVKGIQLEGKGVITQGERYDFTMKELAAWPDRYQITWHYDAAGVRQQFVEVFRGDKAWTKDENGVTQSDPVHTKDLRQALYVDYVALLIPLADDPGLNLSSLGESKVRGQEAVGIKVATAGQPDVQLFFEKKTGLLIKSEHRRRDPMTGKEERIEDYYSDYRTINPVGADEQRLKAARISTEGPALLEFVRKRTVSTEQKKKISELIGKLGDGDFEVREKAKADLTKLGDAAMPLLNRATHNSDPEIAGRAKECLEQMGSGPDPALLQAILRVIAQRRPPGATEVLLNYLPSSPSEVTTEEVRAALAAVAVSEGKPDQVLAAALTDSDPERRATAEAALGKAAVKGKTTGSRLLLLAGVKYPWKGERYTDGKESVTWEMIDVKFYSALDDHLFDKPTGRAIEARSK